MNKTEYITKYANLTICDYEKMTKKQLVEIMAEFWEGLENGVQEYCTPYGDSWIMTHEVSYWYEKHFKKNGALLLYVDRDENGEIVGKNVMWRKKDFIVNYVLVLDMAYASMNEVFGKHRFHDCLENIRKMLAR